MSCFPTHAAKKSRHGWGTPNLAEMGLDSQVSEARPFGSAYGRVLDNRLSGAWDVVLSHPCRKNRVMDRAPSSWVGRSAGRGSGGQRFLFFEGVAAHGLSL